MTGELEQIQAAVAKMEWQPGVNITVSEHPMGDSFFVEVSTEVDDAYKPGEHTTVRVQEMASFIQFIDWELNVERLCGFIHFMQVKLAVHEIDEWFKYDGKRIRDWHRSESNARP